MLRVGYKSAFVRQYKKLPPALQQEVRERIALFRRKPTDPSLRVHKLKGPLKGQLSFSVNYAFRVVFFYQDKQTAVLLAVGDHSIYS